MALLRVEGTGTVPLQLSCFPACDPEKRGDSEGLQGPRKR